MTTQTQVSNMADAHSRQDYAVIKISNVLSLIGMSRASLYRVIANPELKFPKPFRLGLRDNAWFRKDIEAWIQSRAYGVTA